MNFKTIYSNCNKYIKKCNTLKSSRHLLAATIVGVFSMVITSVNAQNLSDAKVKELFKLSNASLSIPELKQQWVVSDAYYDDNTGINYIYLQQTYLGVKVFNAIKTIAIKDNKLSYFTGKFVNRIERQANSTIPSITANDAVTKAANYLHLSNPTNLVIVSNELTAKNKITFTDGGIAKEKIEAELFWVSTDDFKSIKLGWNINIDDKNSPDWWNVRVDAINGNYLDKNNWNVSCNYGKKNTTAHVNFNNKSIDNLQNTTENWNKKILPPLNITTASYYVIPFPLENINVGSMAIETDPWLKAGVTNNATTYKWNFDGTSNYNITRGNNVFAYDDSLKKNAPGRADTSSTAIPNLTFGKIPNFTAAPTTKLNRAAAVTNLFYWNNIMHDITYQYGFDEVGGNFQNNNLNRGGAGNDYVKAEAQDGSGTDNANFATPNDGTSGRMQMYLWTHTPKLDGDFDNGIMCHEYTHGISTRLTGGPSQSGCLYNAEEGGEGWSDYVALMVTTNWVTAKITDGSLKRSMGNYAIGQPQTNVGIRTYPYSTNKSIDPHTYANVSKSVGGSVGEVHYIGEIWCSALWDMTWNIILQEGSLNPNIYDANGGGGNTIAMKLVMQGMKLQPCSPGFLDARDAILAADSILYNNKHKCAIWKAFAGRGMGFSARQGSSTSVTDQTVASDLPSNVVFSNQYEPIIISKNQQVTIPIKTNCTCKTPTKNYTVKAFLPTGLTYNSSTGGVPSGNVVKFSSINYLVNYQTDSQTVTVTATGSGCKIDSVINDNRDNNTKGGFTNFTSNGGFAWDTTTAHAYSPVTAWNAVDDTTITDFALVSAPFVPKTISMLSFQYLFDLETTYDGGVVEYSTDNGATWTDALPLFTKRGYNSAIDSAATSSLLAQPAFSGSTNGSFIHSLVNLSSLAGQSVNVRFRLSTDQGNQNGAANTGWVIDDISVSNGCGGFIRLIAYDSANNIIDSTSIPVFITPSTVPVKYASFNVQAIGKEALLHWVSAEEINTKLYSIERSANAGTWSPIGTTTVADLNKEYSFYDESPLSGINYYRIKAIDNDGKYTYSDIRKLNFSKEGTLALIVPNPSKYQSKVFVASTATSANISVYDAQSRLVQNLVQPIENGAFVLSTNKLVNGVYILHITTQDGNTYSEKLLIEK